MAGLTLTQARTTVLQHLDDANGRRWNADGTFSIVDVALANGLSRALSDYVTDGGDRFDTQTTATTSAVDGTASLSAIDPIVITEIIVSTGGIYIPLRPVRLIDRELDDIGSARSLVVTYVPEYVLPTNGAHPLVGAGATPANSWQAFDNWVCARTALQLGIKDNELRAALQLLEQDARASVLGRQRVPRSRSWPLPRDRNTNYINNLRWTWAPSAKTLRLVYTQWGMW